MLSGTSWGCSAHSLQSTSWIASLHRSSHLPSRPVGVARRSTFKIIFPTCLFCQNRRNRRQQRTSLGRWPRSSRLVVAAAAVLSHAFALPAVCRRTSRRPVIAFARIGPSFALRCGSFALPASLTYQSFSKVSATPESCTVESCFQNFQ